MLALFALRTAAQLIARQIATRAAAGAVAEEAAPLLGNVARNELREVTYGVSQAGLRARTGATVGGWTEIPLMDEVTGATTSQLARTTAARNVGAGTASGLAALGAAKVASEAGHVPSHPIDSTTEELKFSPPPFESGAGEERPRSPRRRRRPRLPDTPQHTASATPDVQIMIPSLAVAADERKHEQAVQNARVVQNLYLATGPDMPVGDIYQLEGSIGSHYPGYHPELGNAWRTRRERGRYAVLW